MLVCLLEIFIASIKGCIKPIKEGLYGPVRNITKDRILRSNKVKKATEIKINTNNDNIFINIIILKEYVTIQRF